MGSREGRGKRPQSPRTDRLQGDLRGRAWTGAASRGVLSSSQSGGMFLIFEERLEADRGHGHLY